MDENPLTQKATKEDLEAYVHKRRRQNWRVAVVSVAVTAVLAAAYTFVVIEM